MGQAAIQQMVIGMISTNCYLCMNKETKELFIVDPADQADLIVNMADRMGGTPCAILLTHGHFDHIMAVKELREKYRIPVYAHEAEEQTLGDASRNQSGGWALPISLKADKWLTDGQTLTAAGLQLQVIHTPGHTPGSCCYLLTKEKTLFSGDTLFYCSVGRTDFPGGSSRQIKQSLDRLLAGLPGDTTVLPGHGESTTIDFEKRNNPYA